MLQGELFGDEEMTQEPALPLAARMRPRTLDELLGQQHILGPGTVLRRAIESDRVPSLILWGPPGTGKTSLARIIARLTKANFRAVSAVAAGVADLRRIVEEAQKLRKSTGRATILFIDEIHRFNKGQQDVVLPFVEDGIVTLVGTTTENPSFEVNAALLSRCRVYAFQPLDEQQVRQIVEAALADKTRGISAPDVAVSDEALALLARISNGDARIALNALELAVAGTPVVAGKRDVDLAAVQDALQQRALLYDKSGDQHYDTISALHKSVRDSDPDAALYWLGRILEAGEDPLYVARRLVRMAVEDVGLADPAALPLAMAAQQAAHFLGMPEANLALAEATVYLSLAPKSNALYLAYGKVREDLQTTIAEPVPLHLRNAPTRLMKDLGYGKGYRYAHDYLQQHDGDAAESPNADRIGVRLMSNLPPALEGRKYYQPTGRGFEKELGERLRALEEPGH